MEDLKQILEQRFKELESRKQEIGFLGASPVAEGGFIQLPKLILESKDITPGAKLTYTALLYYAWQKESCFPGQDTLGELMGFDKDGYFYNQELSSENKFIFTRG